jgi:Family of unknown function (DUF6489)
LPHASSAGKLALLDGEPHTAGDMKITIDIDCTPQEARAFFGLPDVEPIQEAVLSKVQDRLTGYLEGTDPEALLKLWLPGGLQGLGQMQEVLWKQFMGGISAASAPAEKKGKR